MYQQVFESHSGFSGMVRREQLPTYLPPRERECLLNAAKGLNDREIATQLHIASSTVKTYLQQVFQKVRVADRTKAVVVALEQGLLDFSEVTNPGFLYDSFGRFTPREREVLDTIISPDVDAADNRSLAGFMGVKKSTVRTHLSRMFKKSDLHSKPQLIAHYLAHKKRQDKVADQSARGTVLLFDISS